MLSEPESQQLVTTPESTHSKTVDAVGEELRAAGFTVENNQVKPSSHEPVLEAHEPEVQPVGILEFPGVEDIHNNVQDALSLKSPDRTAKAAGWKSLLLGKLKKVAKQEGGEVVEQKKAA